MALLEERGGGLVGLRVSGVDAMRRRIDTMLEKAVRQNVNLLVFPEMTVSCAISLRRATLPSIRPRKGEGRE
ncbi:hypothetical protein [Desulfatitalea alkaliphila]|uniref:CN hydrolase domain-containing protein n=1 Tax=Desulfatitalea alkaliphila TaxID=2929485 RepID=A0AA41UI07_9BACT|nr:hypothetical protein [Desulfatitalea alkaliphila]MCJ8499559.1 hypothetical protein [Desulfatitalea alkaliphila]